MNYSEVRELPENLSWIRASANTAYVNIECIGADGQPLLFDSSGVPALQITCDDGTARSVNDWLDLDLNEAVPSGTKQIVIAVDITSVGGICYNGGGGADADKLATTYCPRVLNPGDCLTWGGLA